MKQMLLFKKLLIIMDDREPPEVEIFLKRREILVIRRRLEVGDYVVGDIGIERKSALDFLNSIIDGRIFEQAKNLKENFDKAIFIIEGNFFEGLRRINIHENVIRGALISLALDFGMGLIFSRDLPETCEYLYLLAKKSKKGYFSVGKRKTEDPRLNVLMSFPGIGRKLAEKLLSRFGSLEKIFNASFPELKKVVGESKAKKIIEILRGEGNNSGP